MKQKLVRQWKVTRIWFIEAEKAIDAIKQSELMMADEVQATLKAIVIKTGEKEND